MTFDAWLTLAVVVVTIAAMASERVPAPYAMLGGVSVLLVAGVIDAEQAFSGFSNPAPITVAALYVLAGAVEVTGALEGITALALGHGEGRPRARLARVLVPTAAASGFMNNTTIVAMVAPRVDAWARRTGAPASLFLMPICFAATLGGMATLMGTSTNIVVSGLMTEDGQAPLSFFEIGRAGAPLAVVGIVVLLVLAPRLLAHRRAASSDLSDPREFTVEMVVQDGSPQAGRTVADAGLRNLEGVYLVEIEREGRVIAPVAPEEVLVAGDRLTFAGNVHRIIDLQATPGLASAEERHFSLVSDGDPGPRLFEAVVAPGSELVGTTLKRVGFRGRFDGAVLAVHRAGERVQGKLGEVALRSGDVLVVLADTAFRQRALRNRDFIVVSQLGGRVTVRREKVWVVALVTAGLVASVTTGALDILEASIVAAAVLLVTRTLTPQEARRSLDLNVLVLIAASFGLGQAMLASGLAERIADGLTDGLARFGDVGLLAGILIATIALTELLTNNAAAILMFPIAMSTAAQTGLGPRPLAIAVAIGASAGFLTPIGYQTNAMVWGMGGYRFTDFTRVGAALTVVAVAAGLTLIPLGWPLR